MAQKGTTLTSFSGLTDKGEPWIIDLGASDHMTGCEKNVIVILSLCGQSNGEILRWFLFGGRWNWFN